jgi:predicted transposase YdaD
MKTDHPIYLFLRSGPEAFRVLNGGLEFWFFERYNDKSAQEIWTMLNLVTPIQETKAYQSIYAEGLVDGEARGEAKANARTLQHQLTRRFGPLPAWVAGRIGTAPEAQVEVWLDGIFDATSVEHLLGGEERH